MTRSAWTRCRRKRTAEFIPLAYPFPILPVRLAVGAEGVVVELHPSDRLGFPGHAAENERIRDFGGNQASIVCVLIVMDREHSGGELDGGESAFP